MRAYGPTRERDPWRKAAVRLKMPVFAPTYVDGLALNWVNAHPNRCGPGKDTIIAEYQGPRKSSIDIAEGRPHVCGNLGNTPLVLLSHPRIHGRRSDLYETCRPLGCSKARGTYALFWKELGVEIGILTKGVEAQELLNIGRGMTLVLR